MEASMYPPAERALLARLAHVESFGKRTIGVAFPEDQAAARALEGKRVVTCAWSDVEGVLLVCRRVTALASADTGGDAA